ncbi:helix-turn-helix transcriptional regulator [Mammaliicoccus sp. F-M27]|uniref:helix-turn-helix domain-containing protein n=1 Tax=Mammaliicoccus sp. F-M27 TaxID=2898687 RepID=UPI001EFB4695|nr:helix-turn-helix transcriptional regulator [Mammaliicoccus sp. F-M27]
MKNYSESMEIYKYICYELRLIRKDKKLTLADVSNDVDISVPYLGTIERADKKTTGLMVILNLAKYYDVDFKDLVRNAELRMEIEKTLEE